MKVDILGYIGNVVAKERPLQRYIGRKHYNVGDVLDISSLKHTKNPEEYVCSGFWENVRQFKRYMSAFGVNFVDIIKGNAIHYADAMPSGMFEYPIISVKRLANIPVKTRNNKVVDCVIDKVNMGNIYMNDTETFYYVLKHNGKQLGYINVTRHPDNTMYIDYLTNVLGRKKFRNTEKILVQAAVEDCMKKGFVPEISAAADNVARLMGRGYNNSALYKKMGMSANDDEYPIMSVSSSKVIDLLRKYLKFNGEILSGSAERLETIKH